LAENVGTRNGTAGSKAYLIEAYGAVGASINDPFYFTVSTSSTYDAFETDENALHAYAFTVATGGSTLVSRSINSEVDQDWYKITVPESRNYDAMHIDLDQASVGNGYKPIVRALSNNRMALIPSKMATCHSGTGAYYLRVYTTNAYSDTNYSLHLQPVLEPTNLLLRAIQWRSMITPAMHTDATTGLRNNLRTGVAATSDNYAVANSEVEVIWENEGWTEAAITDIGRKAVTNSSGRLRTLSLPPSTGSVSQYLPAP
jgi:hypothetical protein